MNNEKILRELQDALGEVYQTKLNPNDLRVALENIGLHKDNVLMEFSVIDNKFDDNQKTIQIYFTLTDGYNKEYELEIYRILNELSQKNVAGYFGIYEPLKQIYYRYNLYIPKYNEASTLIVLNVVRDIVTFLSVAYDYVLMISDNPIDYTFDDYLEELENMKNSEE